MKRLYDIAKIIRSKNAGPFSITLDILFSSEKDYEAVKKARLISRESIASAYQIKEEDITELVFFDQALGIKVTFNREISSGTSGDRDVYGAQQHAPLMAISFDEAILS
ncbi:hypothetical protein HNQ56_004632 [Anaerotaenia torta]|uniref:DUF4387 domain-containing protein n=1 Tax=Anaerotaenia torta TaxID=433293 RepID=UPI003D208FB0